MLIPQSIAQSAGATVLVLHSYDESYTWTASVTTGIRATLEGHANLNLHFFHLDAQRYPLSIHTDLHDEYLHRRYQNQTAPDIVLTVDDDALRFMLSRRDTLFPDSTLLFTGINNLASYDPAELDGLAGYEEAPDIQGTLTAALAMLPKTSTLAVLADDTTSGRLNLERFRALESSLPASLSVLVLDQPDSRHLKQALSKLPGNSIILYLSWLHTPAGENYSISESVRFIREHSKAPIFGCWDFLLPAGITGGHVVSGEQLGRHAAALVLQQLGLPKPESAADTEAGYYRHIYDFTELSSLGVAKSRIPANSQLLHAPPAIPVLVLVSLIALAGIAALEALTLLLLAASRRKLALAELDYRILAEHVPLTVYRVRIGNPNQRLYISPQLQSYFGIDPKLWLEQRDEWLNLIHPEDRQRVLDAYDLADREHCPTQLQYRLVLTDGSIRWIQTSWNYYSPKGGRVYALGFMQDVSTIVEHEQEISRALQERELLLREIHHRVKNNLQIVASLLRLESSELDDQAQLAPLHNAEQRVFAMSLVHELLYTQDLYESIEIHAYIQSLSAALFSQTDSGFPQLIINGPELAVALDQAIPVGLILNEILVNILKHAFPPGFSGVKEINITYKAENNHLFLNIRDNGVGLYALKEQNDQAGTQHLGMSLIESLVQQLNGKLEIEGWEGTRISISFPLA